MKRYRQVLGLGAILTAGLGVGIWISQSAMASAPWVIAALVMAAVWVNLGEEIRTYAFSLWVFSAVALSMFYPATFGTWGGYKLTGLISPLIQIIMFGVGTQLSVADFKRAFQMPKAVLIGVVAQFAIMPTLGFTLTRLFGFEGEVAAGVVLIGSCPSGVASNVMAYIAGANVALSVTVTSFTTLLAPIMTPLAMKVLAGQYVEIEFSAMALDILWMIITPVVAGLVVNKLAHGRAGWFDRMLPVISMVSICFIIAIITASSRDKLLQVGPLLIMAAMLHNGFGYLFGYWSARLFGMAERDARVVSFEVGMQNGGMGSALAINVLKSSDAALASAIFGPWMNISGSVLASFWRKRLPQGVLKMSLKEAEKTGHRSTPE
ncbi:MAG: bile acid:sodium symporter family protein [Bryobacterales bacterium]|nr:bile acid:sodium symporter family protein [Bryobacterales bacterium]